MLSTTFGSSPQCPVCLGCAERHSIHGALAMDFNKSRTGPLKRPIKLIYIFDLSRDFNFQSKCTNSLHLPVPAFCSIHFTDIGCVLKTRALFLWVTCLTLGYSIDKYLLGAGGSFQKKMEHRYIARKRQQREMKQRAPNSFEVPSQKKQTPKPKFYTGYSALKVSG